MTIQERVNHYASSYSGILPKEVIESSKEWWRKELEGAAEEAREEERKKIVEWCKQRTNDNITTYGTDKWNSDLDDLLAHLSDK